MSAVEPGTLAYAMAIGLCLDLDVAVTERRVRALRRMLLWRAARTAYGYVGSLARLLDPS